MSAPEKKKSFMGEFKTFIARGNVMDMAVGVIIGAAFGSITGSSVTTIVGLLMLVFMRFKIGMDLGIVLAKGVLCSLLCVFTVLPGLILWADKLVRKTTKKPRAPKRERRSVLAALGRFSYRWRGAIAAAFVLLFAGTYILQLSTQIAYTLTDADPVAEVFPPDNPIVVLYNNADEDAVAALADRLEADPNVKSAMAYSTTLGRQYTAAQMANVVGALDASIPVSADMLGMIYYDAHSGGRAVTIPAGRFLRFVTDHVANNAAFAPYLDAGMTANLQTLQKFTDPAALTQQRTAESLAGFLGMDAADAKQLLLYYYTQHGDASTGGMTLPAFSDFLVNEVLTDSTLADMVDASAREQAATLQTFTDVSAMTTPRGCDEIAQMLGMDEDTVRLLFVAYHTLNGDLLTGDWNVSMQTLVNFLAEHSALLDDAQAQQITMLSRIINGSVDGTSYSAAELADLLGMDAGQVRQLYLLYTSRHGDTSGWTLSVQQFVDFLCQEVLPDARFAGQLSGVDTSQLQSARTVIDAVASGRSYTAAELANLFQGLSSQLDRGTMELLFLYYASVYSSDASWTMSMQELFDYLQNDLLTDARFASFLTDDMRAQITDAQTMLTDAVTQLRGSNYSRLVLTTTLPGESDETSAFIAQLMQDLDAVTTGDYYLIGNSAMVYEMENSFDSELLLITLLTAASIFLVVVFTFRSLIIPALLVLLVAIGLKFRKSAKYIFLLGKEITNTRRRHNVFDDTVRESSFLLLLNTVTLLSEGLLLYLYLLGGGRPELPGAAACMGVALGYGLFLWAAYGLTGWVFSDADTMRVWVRGHNAATGLLCVVMLPLALAAAADTSIATTVAPVALGAFLVAKLIFIFKGARIFMHGPTSILLFFYYLCSLEIVPLVLAYAAARFLLDAVA